MSIEGLPSDNVSVTTKLVAELAKHTTRVCPLECKSGETLKGETCIADEKAKAPATASRKNEDEEDARSRRKQTSRQPDREEPRRARPAPEAPARPPAGRCTAEHCEWRWRRRQNPGDHWRWFLTIATLSGLI